MIITNNCLNGRVASHLTPLIDCAAVSLVVRRVPAKLRSIELQRQSNYSGGSEASLLSAVMDQVRAIPTAIAASMTMRPSECNISL